MARKTNKCCHSSVNTHTHRKYTNCSRQSFYTKNPTYAHKKDGVHWKTKHYWAWHSTMCTHSANPVGKYLIIPPNFGDWPSSKAAFHRWNRKPTLTVSVEHHVSALETILNDTKKPTRRLKWTWLNQLISTKGQQILQTQEVQEDGGVWEAQTPSSSPRWYWEPSSTYTRPSSPETNNWAPGTSMDHYQGQGPSENGAVRIHCCESGHKKKRQATLSHVPCWLKRNKQCCTNSWLILAPFWLFHFPHTCYKKGSFYFLWAHQWCWHHLSILWR